MWSLLDGVLIACAAFWVVLCIGIVAFTVY